MRYNKIDFSERQLQYPNRYSKLEQSGYIYLTLDPGIVGNPNAEPLSVDNMNQISQGLYDVDSDLADLETKAIISINGTEFVDTFNNVNINSDNLPAYNPITDTESTTQEVLNSINDRIDGINTLDPTLYSTTEQNDDKYVHKFGDTLYGDYNFETNGGTNGSATIDSKPIATEEYSDLGDEDVKDYVSDNFVKKEGDTITGGIFADSVYRPFNATNDDGTVFGVVNKWKNGYDRYVPFVNSDGDYSVIVRDENNNLINGVRQLRDESMYDYNLQKYFAYRGELVELWSGASHLEEGASIQVNLGGLSWYEFEVVIFFFTDWDVGVGINNYNIQDVPLYPISSLNGISPFFDSKLLPIASVSSSSGSKIITKGLNIDADGTINGKTVYNEDERDVVLFRIVGIKRKVDR